MHNSIVHLDHLHRDVSIVFLVVFFLLCHPIVVVVVVFSLRYTDSFFSSSRMIESTCESVCSELKTIWQEETLERVKIEFEDEKRWKRQFKLSNWEMMNCSYFLIYLRDDKEKKRDRESHLSLFCGGCWRRKKNEISDSQSYSIVNWHVIYIFFTVAVLCTRKYFLF